MVDAVDKQDPYSLTRYVTKKVSERLDSEQGKIQENPDYLRRVVHEELLPYCQVKYMGALVLGTYYKTASSSQRDDFFDAFGKYLELEVGARSLYRLRGATVEDGTAEKDENPVAVSVTTQVDGVDVTTRLQWRKNSATGQWQWYDLITDGQSLITSRQNEWSETLRTKGVDGLTRELLLAAKQPVPAPS
ncbi:phospholipid-binding protein MlaC [Streptomyces sp. NPDC006984]|uniref:phospholipid-binding protein MlaC n=1 Tax=Streptomyces sp. NPDC006984 TaxID=3155463 RepID=UPI0033C42A38